MGWVHGNQAQHDGRLRPFVRGHDVDLLWYASWRSGVELGGGGAAGPEQGMARGGVREGTLRCVRDGFAAKDLYGRLCCWASNRLGPSHMKHAEVAQ